MLDLNHLANFVAVARHGSYHRAAAEIHLSQSALSRSIQALEKAVGRQLLIRSRGGVRLTAHGTIVADHARILLREKQRLLEELELAETSAQGRIRIGVGFYAANGPGIEAASCLVNDDGQLLCQLTINDYRNITQDLLAHRIDLGLCDVQIAANDARIHCIPLRREQLFPYTRPQHPLQQAETTATADLFQFPLITTRIPARLDSIVSLKNTMRVDELTGEALPTLNAVAPELVLRLLLNTNAIAFGPLSMIERPLADGLIALLPIRDPDLSIDQGFIHLAEDPPGKLALRYMDRVRDLDAIIARRNRELETTYGVGAG